jgi:hypothetical protein
MMSRKSNEDTFKYKAGKDDTRTYKTSKDNTFKYKSDRTYGTNQESQTENKLFGMSPKEGKEDSKNDIFKHKASKVHKTDQGIQTRNNRSPISSPRNNRSSSSSPRKTKEDYKNQSYKNKMNKSYKNDEISQTGETDIAIQTGDLINIHEESYHEEPYHGDNKLEMEALNKNYEEYLKQEENLSGVLNTKTLAKKNIELKEKIKYWRDSRDSREQSDEKINDKEKQVWELILKYLKEVNVDKGLLEHCKDDFFEMMEYRHAYYKNENILNDFLLTLDETRILEIRDLKNGLERYRNTFFEDHAMLNVFVDKISKECVINHNFFSFFDVADLIVKLVPSKTDYSK